MNTNQLQYENSNTKNLINEIYCINPHIMFTTFVNVISEKRNHDVISCYNNKNANLVYIPIFRM